jgi:hypothetical protein
MSRPNVYEFNAETQEEISREMNDEEYAQHENDMAAAAQRVAAQEEAATLAAAKAAAKAEALAQLGLSQEVINLLAD